MDEKKILEEKLMQKIRQAKYYKEKYEEAQNTIKEMEKYIDKMSYQSVVDNPKKDLIKILRKEK